jgi:hypothetical protein
MRELAAQHEPSPMDRPCGTCGAKAGRRCYSMDTGNGNRQQMEECHEARINPPSGALFDTPIEKR